MQSYTSTFICVFSFCYKKFYRTLKRQIRSDIVNKHCKTLHVLTYTKLMIVIYVLITDFKNRRRFYVRMIVFLCMFTEFSANWEPIFKIIFLFDRLHLWCSIFTSSGFDDGILQSPVFISNLISVAASLAGQSQVLLSNIKSKVSNAAPNFRYNGNKKIYLTNYKCLKLVSFLQWTFPLLGLDARKNPNYVSNRYKY